MYPGGSARWQFLHRQHERTRANQAEPGDLLTPVRPVLPRTVLSRFSPELATFATCSCCLVLASAEEFVDKWWTAMVVSPRDS